MNVNKLWKQARKEYMLFAIVGLFMVLGLVNSLCMVVAFIVGIGAVGFLSVVEASSLMFLLLPYANIYKLTPTGASYFSYLQILMVIRLLFQTKWINRKFLLCFGALCVVFVVGSQLNFLVLIKQLCIPLLVYLMLRRNAIDVTRMTESLSIGVLTSSILAVIMVEIPVLSSYVKKMRAYDVEGLVYRFCSITNDPNYYSVIVILSVVGIIVLLSRQELSKMWSIVAVALMGFGTQTLSKSFYLMALMVCAVCLWLAIKRKKYFIVFGGCVVVIVGILLIVRGRIEVVNQLLQRFDMPDVTTGRRHGWGVYFTEFAERPLALFLGHGIGADLLQKGVAHNTYIDMLYYYGILGSLFFVAAIVFCVKRKIYWKMENLLPLCCFFAMGMFLSYVLSYDFALLMVFALNHLQYTHVNNHGGSGMDIRSELA